MASKNSMDLTTGSVIKKLALFAFPLWFATLIQQLYHAADVIVVGNFAKDSTTALAAVGSTGYITNLLLNLFVGLSVGASVICAQLYGAQDRAGLRRAMATSLLASLISGVFISVVGFVFARPLLLLMGSPASVIDQATLYMKIIFIGKPAVLIYNTASAIMRAYGDSKRSMYILTATGLVNVLLNLVFVIGFHWDAAGVAVATVVAQYLSAFVALKILFHPQGEYRLQILELRIHREELLKIVKIGVPAGFNGMMFSFSNVIVNSTVNTMGAESVAAVSAATSVSSIVSTVVTAFSTACVSFAGQNYGARKFGRINRLLWSSIFIVEIVFFSANVLLSVFPDFFLGLYTEEREVIRLAIPKLMVVCWGYLIYLVSEMASGCSRGLGRTLSPTITNLFAICATRVGWVLFVFPHLPRNLFYLYLCYPLSWFISSVAQLVIYYISKNQKEKEYQSQKSLLSTDV